MARPRTDSPVDLAAPHDLTVGLIERLQCPPGKSQAFLRDGKGNGLRVRITNKNAKSFVFEAKMAERNIRLTLGDVDTWAIDEARVWARQQQAMVDAGADPRDVKSRRAAQREAEREKEKAEAEKQALTGLTAWAEYIEGGRTEGQSERGAWSARHYADHVTLADPGGVPFKRGTGTTAPGPLYALLSRPLIQIDQAAVEDWLRKGNATRAARMALSFRLLRAFFNWCGEHPRFQHIIQADALKPRAVRKLVRRPKPPKGVLQREQLAAWFEAVRADPDHIRSCYLQCLLLTGARKSEIAEMEWESVVLKFGGTLQLKDKVAGERKIPCTPEVARLLKSLPRNSPFVFGDSALTLAHNAAYNHRKALAAAGLPHLTLQALRKSYGTLAEWVKAPVGVVAQLQGHKPSATAEVHYRERPLDMLRMWADEIEAWMLKEARFRGQAKAEK